MISQINNIVLLLELASILAGETPACPIEAKISAADVWEVNSVWYGRGNAQFIDYQVAFGYKYHPNPTPGAKYFIHPNDAKKMRSFLKELIKEWVCVDAHGNVVTIVQAWK
jgi:hypothetical protein